MSKYVIELGYDLQRVVGVGVKQGTVWVKDYDIDNLEELCADYINEHFGDLQDEAYKRGLEDGKRAAVGAAELREKLEYQKGFEDGKAQVERGCDGCKYAGKVVTGPPCITCCNSYKNQWQAKEDKIEVGDEVNWLGDCFIVTRIFQPHNMKEQCDGIDDDGCVYHDVLMDDIEKTGRHFDIASILEDMRK